MSHYIRNLARFLEEEQVGTKLFQESRRRISDRCRPADLAVHV
jgi:hypothetical protein